MATDRDPKRSDNLREGYDPEFEVPDPEQVEEDRAEAEELYGEDEDKESAA